MDGYQNFTDLKCWKKARELKREIWKLLESLPREEKYRLSDQLLRSARSVLANIAEGNGRSSLKDQIYFCILSRGSLSECLNHLIDAYDCNYISTSTIKHFKELIDETARILNGYISFLKNELKRKTRERKAE